MKEGLTAVGLAVLLYLAGIASALIAVESMLQELDAYRQHEEEVRNWMAFLETDNPRRAKEGLPVLPSALMRGLAEQSADHYWPRPGVKHGETKND